MTGTPESAGMSGDGFWGCCSETRTSEPHLPTCKFAEPRPEIDAVQAPSLIPIPNVACAKCGAGLAWRTGVGRYVISHDNGDDICSRASVRLADEDREAASRAYRLADEAFQAAHPQPETGAAHNHDPIGHYPHCRGCGTYFCKVCNAYGDHSSEEPHPRPDVAIRPGQAPPS